MQTATSIGFLSVHPHQNPLLVHESRLVRNHETRQMSSLEDVAQVMISRSWASCLWRDGHAKQDHFIEAWGIVVDVDKNTTLAVAERMIESVDHVIVTTKRHQSKETPWDRFRIYLPTWEPIRSSNDYRATVYPLYRAMKADLHSLNSAHHWKPGLKIHSIHQAGRRIPVRHYSPPKQDPFKQIILPGQGKTLAAVIMQNFNKYGGRQRSCFIAANRLKEGGYNERSAFEYLKTLTDLPQGEINHAVRQAYK